MKIKDLDRFRLASNAIDWIPELAARGAYLKQILRGEWNDHKAYVREHGEDIQEIKNWLWKKHGAGSWNEGLC